MRTFTNKPGTVFDANKTTVLFAEDLNEFKDKIESKIDNTTNQNVGGVKTFTGTEIEIKRLKDAQRRLVFSNSTDAHQMIVYQPAGTNDLRIYNTVTATDVINFKQDGKVGIGTITPLRTLEINNSARFTNSDTDLNNGVFGANVFGDGFNIVGTKGASDIRRVSIWGNITNRESFPPSTSTSPGQPGEIAFDLNYIYYCVSTNSWKRVAISTW